MSASIPGVTQFESNDGTTLVKVVTFGLLAATEVATPTDTDLDVEEDVVVQPVDLIAGPGWVVACWHNSELLGDTDQSYQQGPVTGLIDSVLAAVTRRLPAGRTAREGHLPTSSEVALRIAERLSRRYAEVVRHLEDLVDAWGVEFGHGTVTSRGMHPSAQHELSALQVQVAGLLRRLRPLASQLEAETETVRRPGWALGDHEYERAVRWHRALATSESRLMATADDVRACYQLIVVEQMSEQLRRTEEVRRLEVAQATRDQWFASLVAIGAAILLVPATVAGIWGMNVGVPGVGDPQWFWIVLAIMLVATILVVVLFGAAWRFGSRRLTSRRPDPARTQDNS